MDGADGEDCGVQRIGIAGDHLVECGDELCGGEERVGGVLRTSGVSAAALNHERDFVDTGGEYAVADTHTAGWKSGVDVQPEDAADTFECSGVDHPFRAFGCFFCGLEDESQPDGGDVCFRQTCGEASEQFGGGKYDGGVDVMAAGVSDSGAG